MEDALQLLDTFLEGQKYVAGPNLTVADLSIVAGVSSFEASDIDFKKYANVKRLEQTLNTYTGRNFFLSIYLFGFSQFIKLTYLLTY